VGITNLISEKKAGETMYGSSEIQRQDRRDVVRHDLTPPLNTSI
jgi:hypothetical protein